MVANAPLKLPTGVRAALTMTTSSDMGISWGLRFSKTGGRAPDGRGQSRCHPVKLVEACQRPQALFAGVVGQFGAPAASSQAATAPKVRNLRQGAPPKS